MALMIVLDIYQFIVIENVQTTVSIHPIGFEALS